MFGLMRSRSCALGPEERRRRRLHYCGTCKTMGRLYGQRARLLLNFDTVFAAELLTALSGADALDSWDAAYQAQNCFRLPGSTDAMPAELRYAAAMTVVLAEVKVADQLEDAPGARWRAAHRLLSPSFRRAAADLEAGGFPLDALWRSVRAQSGREARLGSLVAPAADGAERALDDAAQATADATALAFEHGAGVAGVPETREQLAALGRAFGSLVYLLDALDDYERDARSGEFNAIRAAFGSTTGPLPLATRRAVERRLRALEAEAETALARLPLQPERAALFVDRLRSNLARARVVRRLPVVSGGRRTAAHACTRVSLAARRAAAAALARSATSRHLAGCNPLPIRWAQAPFVFALAGVAGFVAPHLASAAAPSMRDCFDATFNVAAIGSALAAAAMPPPPPDQLDPKRRKQQEAAGQESESSGCCDWCDCCDCCDGCGSCHGCDCHGCGGCCDGCNCCEGCNCCDGCDCSCD